MSFESVDIYVKDDTASQAPVEDVVVRVFDQTGTTFFSQATTDADGRAAFTLPAPATYSVRFYKFQVSFTQPQLVQVLEAPVAPDSNLFDISAHVFSPPEAVDPRLCRCSGFFRSPNGLPAKNVDIHVIAKFDPILLEGDALLTERLTLRTGKDGYVEIDLIRFAKYDVTVEGFEDCQRSITIPDSPSANFPDLLFAVVEQITFSPAGPWSLAVGSELTLTPQVYASDGNLLEGTAMLDVYWKVEDPSIVNLQATQETLILRGLAAGSTTLIAERADTSIIRIPNTPIQGVPVGITVT